MFAIFLLGGFLLLVMAFITFRQLRAGEQNRLRLLAGFADQVETTIPELVQRFVTVVDLAESPTEIGPRLESVPNVRLVECSEGLPPRFEIVAGGPQIALRYPLRPPDETEADSAGSDGSGEETQDLPPEPGKDEVYCALLDVPGVVRPIAIPEVFDLTVLARRDEQGGTVLFQDGEPELKLADVGAAWEVQRAGMMESLRQVWDDEAGAPDPTGGGTRVIETEIAGIDYRLFVQPVTLHLQDPGGEPLGEPQHWVACGIVSWQRLLSSSFTTSPVLLFLMVALFPLMLVSWPFLKMWLISRREPFTRFDVAALVFATLAGLSLLTLASFDFVFLSEVRQEVDGQLETLATNLEANFQREVLDAAIQLSRFRDDEPLCRAFADPLPRSGSEIDWSPVVEHFGKDPALELTYPLLHSVFWTDYRGEQVSKVPFHEDALLRNRVRDRGYFRCPQRRSEIGDLPGTVAAVRWTDWDAARREGPESLPKSGESLCIESIRSKTTAGDLAVVSLPAASCTPPDDSPRGHVSRPEPIIALVTRLASMSHPLLAPGVSFAVLNQRGRVLFHSDARRNVTEDFLKATNGNSVLAAMLTERRSGPIVVNYWGTRYRAHVHRMSGLPWSLVTLRSTRDLRTRNFELVYDFLNPFLIYLSSSALVLGLVILLAPRRHLKYLWPSGSYAPGYQTLVRFTPLLFVVFAFLTVYGSPGLLASSAVVLPALGLLLLLPGLLSSSASPDRQTDGLSRGEERLQALATKVHGVLARLEGPALALGTLGAVVVLLDRRGALPIALGTAALLSAFGAWALRRQFAEQGTDAPYAAALTAMLLLAAVLPAAAFFRLAESRQAQLLLQDTQLGLLRAFDRRDAALAADGGPVADQLPTYTERLDELRERSAGSFFDSEISEGEPSGAEPWKAPVWPYGRQERLGLARLLASRAVPLNDLTADPVATDLSRYRYDGTTWERRRGRLRALWREEPSLGSSRSSGSPRQPLSVTSRFTDLGLEQTLAMPRRILICILLLLLALLVVGAALFISRKILLVELAPNRRQAALRQILHQVARNGKRAQRMLVLTSLPDAVEQMAATPPFRGRFHVLPFRKLWWEGRDMRERRKKFLEALDAEKSSSGDWEPKAVLLSDFRPELDDPREADEQIGLLQELWRHAPGERRRSMIIVTSRAYHRLTRPSATATEEITHDQIEARSKWGSFLARFSQRYGRHDGKRDLFERWVDGLLRDLKGKRWPSRAEPRWFASEDVGGSPAPEAPVSEDSSSSATMESGDMGRFARLLRVVRDECKWTWRLQRVGIDIIRELGTGLPLSDEGSGSGDEGQPPSGDPVWNPPTRKQLVERIGFAAHPYYQRIWDRCSPEERLVLYQLARYGVVNPKSFDRSLDLLNKGLIVRTPDDPVLRPMNQSFAAFVRRAVRRWEVWRWEDEEGISAWSVWKWVLPVPLMLLGAFLFVTQQDAVSNVIGVVVAVAAVLPTGINLYQHFRQATAGAQGTEP